MRQSIKHFAAGVAFAAFAFASSPFASAQSYPAKPLRIIVPFAPGGGVDFMARLIAQKLPETLGQQVIVENRGGAGGVPGTEAALRSPPDGYTLLMISSTYPVSPSLSSSISIRFRTSRR
jgi:tripartite-type tricarboxylate transporter receptor subunit TctC